MSWGPLLVNLAVTAGVVAALVPGAALAVSDALLGCGVGYAAEVPVEDLT